ncbi:MAG: hypothetical protein V3W04_02135 [Gammaproteobacteria bacterium]
MGLRSLLFAPERVDQAIALANLRAASAALATSFVFVMFKYGGNSLSSIAGNMQSAVNSAANSAARQMSDPAANTQLIKSMAESQGMSASMANTGGSQAMAQASQFRNQTDIGAAQQTIAGYGGDVSAASSRIAAGNAFNSMVSVAAAKDMTRRSGSLAAGANVQGNASAFNEGKSIEALQQLSQMTGKGTGQLARELGGFAAANDAGISDACGDGIPGFRSTCHARHAGGYGDCLSVAGKCILYRGLSCREAVCALWRIILSHCRRYLIVYRERRLISA